MKYAFEMEYVHPVDEKSSVSLVPYSPEYREQYKKIYGSVTLLDDELDDLIVNPEYQGKGYGKQILLWALENINLDRIVLHVAEWNQRAINLYKKTGFEVTETIEIG